MLPDLQKKEWCVHVCVRVYVPGGGAEASVALGVSWTSMESAFAL